MLLEGQDQDVTLPLQARKIFPLTETMLVPDNSMSYVNTTISIIFVVILYLQNKL